MCADTATMTDNRRGSALWVGVISCLSGASGVISGPLLARALGPTGRGEVASVMVYFSILTVILSLGFPLAVGHAVGTNQLSIEAALGAVLRFCALLIVPSLVAAQVLLRGPLGSLTGSNRVCAAVVISCIVIPVFGLCLTYCFLGAGELRPLTIVQAVYPSIMTGAAVLLFASGLLTVASYLAGTVVALALAATTAAVLLRRRACRGSSLVPLLRYGLRGYAGTLAAFAVVRVDQAVIGPLLGQAPLGFYAVGATIAALPPTIALAVAYRTFGNVASADDSMRPAMIVASVRLSVLVAGVVAAVLAIVSPLLLPALYGERFAASVGPLLLLLPGSVALAVSRVIGAIFTATGHLGRVTAAELTGFGVTVIGLPLVVPRWGLVGTAFLSTTAYLITMASYIRSLHLRALIELVPRRSDTALLARRVLGLLRIRRNRSK